MKQTKRSVIASFDAFTKAYVECLLWSTMDEQGEPLERRFGIYDFRMKDLLVIQEECRLFQEKCHDDLSKAYEASHYDASRAGHDFWLTREGHGAGFWDRDLGTVGLALTKSAKAEGSVYVSAYKGTLYYQP